MILGINPSSSEAGKSANQLRWAEVKRSGRAVIPPDTFEQAVFHYVKLTVIQRLYGVQSNNAW